MANSEPPKAPDDPALVTEDRFEAARVEKALDGLTEVQRESVELAYFHGYSHSEVAATLGLPLGTVKTRIRDGLIRLRDQMGVTA